MIGKTAYLSMAFVIIVVHLCSQNLYLFSGIAVGSDFGFQGAWLLNCPAALGECVSVHAVDVLLKLATVSACA